MISLDLFYNVSTLDILDVLYKGGSFIFFYFPLKSFLPGITTASPYWYSTQHGWLENLKCKSMFSIGTMFRFSDNECIQTSIELSFYPMSNFQKFE